jgi:hypothetical protein
MGLKPNSRYIWQGDKDSFLNGNKEAPHRDEENQLATNDSGGPTDESGEECA